MTAHADWSEANLARLRELWASPLTAREIAAAFGDRGRNSIISKAHALGLPMRPTGRHGAKVSAANAQAQVDAMQADRSRPGHVRKAFASLGDDVTLSRWVKTGSHVEPKPRQMKLPGLGNAAVEAGRSVFHRKGIKDVADLPHVLVSGHNNCKIGRDVRKEPFRGKWIYTLSLEERLTCPLTCHFWANCYGNNMPFAKRVRHGPELLAALELEIPQLLGMRGRVGILVRLHALGDFYSVEYVDFWRRMLDEHPRLAVFGYTARLPETPIGDAIATLIADQGARFAIRFSNAGFATGSTVTVRTLDRPVNATLCPEQTGKTAACATCGLCFGRPPVGNIAFLEH